MCSVVVENDSLRLNKAIDLIENSVVVPNLDLITIASNVEYDIQTFNLTSNPPIHANNDKEIANWILSINGLSSYVLVKYLSNNLEVLEMLCGAILLKHGHNYNFVEGFMYYLQVIDFRYCVSNVNVDLKLLIQTFAHVLYETHLSKGGSKNPDIISQFQLLVDYRLFGDILYYILKNDVKMKNMLLSNDTSNTTNSEEVRDINTKFLNDMISHIKISLTDDEEQVQPKELRDDQHSGGVNKKKPSTPNVNQLMEIHGLVSTHLNKIQYTNDNYMKDTYKYCLFSDLSNMLYHTWNVGLFHSGDNREAYYVIFTPVALYLCQYRDTKNASFFRNGYSVMITIPLSTNMIVNYYHDSLELIYTGIGNANRMQSNVSNVAASTTASDFTQGIPLLFHDAFKKHVVDIKYSNLVVFEYTDAIDTCADPGDRHGKKLNSHPSCVDIEKLEILNSDPDIVLTWVDAIEEQLSVALYPTDICGLLMIYAHICSEHIYFVMFMWVHR